LYWLFGFGGVFIWLNGKKAFRGHFGHIIKGKKKSPQNWGRLVVVFSFQLQQS
jgi:hypothetical protein